MPSEADIWRRYDDDEQRLTAPVSERLLKLAGVGPGDRVLDIATGRGEPAVRAAARVRPGGHVLGTDRSDALLAMARERAEREGVSDLLALRVADAHTLEGVPEAAFDVALSRWGLMYFDRPRDALSAVRRRLVPGGRFACAVWTEPSRVPYWEWPRALLRRHGVEASPPAPDGPGEFRYGDAARLREDLAHAGLRVTHEEDVSTPVMEAATGDALVAWCRAFGGNRLLKAAGADGAAQAAWEADVRAEGERLREADGMMRLGGVTRLVVARAA